MKKYELGIGIKQRVVFIWIASGPIVEGIDTQGYLYTSHRFPYLHLQYSITTAGQSEACPIMSPLEQEWDLPTLLCIRLCHIVFSPGDNCLHEFIQVLNSNKSFFVVGSHTLYHLQRCSENSDCQCRPVI